MALSLPSSFAFLYLEPAGETHRGLIFADEAWPARMSTTFVPLPSYLLGALVLLLGLYVLLRPAEEYSRFGLPHEPTAIQSNPDGKPPSGVAISPFVYLKGLREITYGLALMALQWWGQDTAVTILLGVLSLAALGDGLVVWIHGGKTLQRRAFRHWTMFLGLAGWCWWRSWVSSAPCLES